jgi:hypothetical protein
MILPDIQSILLVANSDDDLISDLCGFQNLVATVSASNAVC